MGGIGLNETAQSWKSGQSGRRGKWKGPIASRPIGFISEYEAPVNYVKAKEIIDWVILDEICEVVKYNAMTLIDRLLLVNSPPKMKQLDVVKRNKHIIASPLEPLKFKSRA